MSQDFSEFSTILENPGFEKIVEELVEVDPDALAEILGSASRTSFVKSNNDTQKEKINEMILDLYSKDLILDNDLAGMVVRNADRDPFDLWSWISNSEMGVTKPKTFEGQVRSGVVRRLVERDAPKALAEISANESATTELAQAITVWGKNSPQKANEWYINERVNLTQAQQDASASAFANLALDYFEHSGAETWANQINDPEIRDALLAKISGSDKQVVTD